MELERSFQLLNEPQQTPNKAIHLEIISEPGVPSKARKFKWPRAGAKR